MTFSETVWQYYREHPRHFSWRTDPTPYRVLVSEMMLQQTQTARIETRFPSFLKRFPTLEALATSSLSMVLSEWQGLGYNRRGKYLFETARAIHGQYAGIVPKDPAVLRNLPGIGAYTAASIPCFAYNLPTVFIETNIRTVYLHHFFCEVRDVDDKDILSLIARDVDPTHPREWYYALMDYGVHLKATVGSLNHQSKHYRQQSKFAGSNREVRATLLKHLLHRPHTLEQLQACFPPSEKRVVSNLQSLVREGLLIQRDGWYEVAT